MCGAPRLAETVMMGFVLLIQLFLAPAPLPALAGEPPFCPARVALEAYRNLKDRERTVMLERLTGLRRQIVDLDREIEHASYMGWRGLWSRVRLLWQRSRLLKDPGFKEFNRELELSTRALREEVRSILAALERESDRARPPLTPAQREAAEALLHRAQLLLRKVSGASLRRLEGLSDQELGNLLDHLRLALRNAENQAVVQVQNGLELSVGAPFRDYLAALVRLEQMGVPGRANLDLTVVLKNNKVLQGAIARIEGDLVTLDTGRLGGLSVFSVHEVKVAFPGMFPLNPSDLGSISTRSWANHRGKAVRLLRLEKDSLGDYYGLFEVLGKPFEPVRIAMKEVRFESAFEVGDHLTPLTELIGLQSRLADLPTALGRTLTRSEKASIESLMAQVESFTQGSSGRAQDGHRIMTYKYARLRGLFPPTPEGEAEFWSRYESGAFHRSLAELWWMESEGYSTSKQEISKNLGPEALGNLTK